MLEILERVEAAKMPERAPGSPRTATVRMNPEEWEAEDKQFLPIWRKRAEHYLDKKVMTQMFGKIYGMLLLLKHEGCYVW